MIKLVGKYMLGFRAVRLYVDTKSCSGSVDLLPDDKGSAIVCIGIDCPFEESTATLLHEVYEATLIDINTRYKRTPSFSGESSDYIFVMTHNELGEAHERVGVFMVEAYEDFKEIYEKLQRKMSRKKQLDKRRGS